MNLTKRQQELLKEFERAGAAEETSPESSGFFARVKELFEDLRESPPSPASRLVPPRAGGTPG